MKIWIVKQNVLDLLETWKVRDQNFVSNLNVENTIVTAFDVWVVILYNIISGRKERTPIDDDGDDNDWFYVIINYWLFALCMSLSPDTMIIYFLWKHHSSMLSHVFLSPHATLFWSYPTSKGETNSRLFTQRHLSCFVRLTL